MKREAPLKAKFKLAKRRLGLAQYELMGALEAIFHLTAESAPRGDLGRHYSDEEIEAAIDWSKDPPGSLIEALIATRWLDVIDGPDRLAVHGWFEHCEPGVHRKVARAREYFVTGERPKLASFTKQQREAIQAWYDDQEAAAPASESAEARAAPEVLASRPGASGGDWEAPRRGKTEAPDDLSEPEKSLLRTWLKQSHPEKAERMQDLIDACLCHHRAKGNRMSSWYAAVQTWIRREEDFRPQARSSNGANGGRAKTISQAGDRLLSRLQPGGHTDV